jgi:hypothetical protein
MAYDFVARSPTLALSIIPGDLSPSDYHQFTAPKENLGGHQLT